MHWKHHINFLFATIQCCHDITGGAYYYFNTNNVHCYFWVIGISKIFGAKKYFFWDRSCWCLSCFVPVCVKNFDTHKSVEENMVCFWTLLAKFPKEAFEMLSVWSLKDAFLKLIWWSFFSTVSMVLTRYTTPSCDIDYIIKLYLIVIKCKGHKAMFLFFLFKELMESLFQRIYFFCRSIIVNNHFLFLLLCCFSDIFSVRS